MAEREGFEPSKRLLVYTLSKRAPSATRPPLLNKINNLRGLFLPFKSQADIRHFKGFANYTLFLFIFVEIYDLNSTDSVAYKINNQINFFLPLL